jgi:hypothetical protein
VSDALESREYLLFSDVKANRLWKWEEGSGLFTIGTSVLLERSGCRYALQSTHLNPDKPPCEGGVVCALESFIGCCCAMFRRMLPRLSVCKCC